MKKVSIFMLSLFIISGIFIPTQKVEAQTLNDIYKELEQKKSETNKVQSQKKLTQKQIDDTKAKIQATTESVSKAEQDIQKARQDIAKLNDDIADKKEETKEILRFFQVSKGQNDYLEYAFGAQDYESFIYRLAVVEQMSEHNTDLLVEMNNLILENQTKQVELKAKQVELNKKQKELKEQLETLGTELDSISSITLSKQQEEEAVRKLAKYYESQGCKRDQDVSTCVKVPAATGFRRPLSKGRVTSEFGYRCYEFGCDSHTAMDIGGNPEGTPVYAAATGVVAGLIYRSSCGGNTIYIHHTVNGVAYTTQYSHLLTMNVSVGQTVTSETQIATVGGGKSTMSYDSCSTGAHLHFGAAYGHYLGVGKNGYQSRTTYLSKLLDPRNLINVPGYYVWFYGR